MSSKRLLPAIVVVLVLAIGFLIVVTASGVWHGTELWSQVCAACMGAIVVAVVTLVLMRGQRVSEEEKEKSVKIHESKIEVYSRFVGKMYSLLADDRLSCDDFLNLRTEVFSSLIFYLDDTNLQRLLGELNGVADVQDAGEMVMVFARITAILQDDVAGRKVAVNDKERVLVDLWHQFDNLTQCRHNQR